MFNKSKNNTKKLYGKLEIICGSMFSGKTKELIARLNKAKKDKLITMVIKPKIDNRYDKNKIVSHDKKSIASKVTNSCDDIVQFSLQAQVVGIDEAQFYNNDLIYSCQKLISLGKRVIIAGLDMDYSGKPFHPIPELMAIADKVTKLHAKCENCNNDALFSKRKNYDKSLIQLGEKNNYIPLCRTCFNESC